MSGIEHSKQREQGQQNQASKPLRIAVLVSGSGSNLQALIDASEHGQLEGIEIGLVISNKANAQGLQRALTHKIPAIYLPWKNRDEAEARAIALFELFQIDLIVMAGFMRIISAELAERYPQRIINLHPALLPNNGEDSYTTSNGTVIPAIRGLNVVKQAMELGLKVTGSSVHYVIPAVDAGPVISRAEVPIESSDTEESLHEKLKEQEHRLIVEAVRKHAAGQRAVGSHK